MCTTHEITIVVHIDIASHLSYPVGLLMLFVSLSSSSLLLLLLMMLARRDCPTGDGLIEDDFGEATVAAKIFLAIY